MKKWLYIFLCVCFAGMAKAQKTNAAFTGEVEKSAQFLYSKSDFDSVMVHFFAEPTPLIICSYYTLELTLKATVDTAGNASDIKFENFELKSNLLMSPDDPALAPLYQDLRNTVRKTFYHTNGMWSPKTKKGLKEKNEVVIKTSIRKRSEKIFNETSDDQQTGGGKIYYYKVGEKRSNPDFFYNYGVARLNEKKYILAKTYFEEVISVDPNDIDAYYNLGLCFLNMGKKQEACKNWDECFRLGDKKVLEAIKKNCDQ